MTNLSRDTVNLPRSFVPSYTNAGGMLQVGDRLLQLVATLSDAYLCGIYGVVTGVTAFSKTFPNENSKMWNEGGEKAYKDNNRDNLPRLPRLPRLLRLLQWIDARGPCGVSVHSPTPMAHTPSPAAVVDPRIIPTGSGTHPVDARGAGPGHWASPGARKSSLRPRCGNAYAWKDGRFEF
jgi:hypothetical protein